MVVHKSKEVHFYWIYREISAFEVFIRHEVGVELARIVIRFWMRYGVFFNKKNQMLKT